MGHTQSLDTAIILQCGGRIWASVYIYVCNAFGPGGHPGGQARVQDGVPSTYTDTDFALLAHEGSETWTSQSLRFTKVGLLQLQHD